MIFVFVFFFQAEDGIRDATVTGVQTCALPILEETGHLLVTNGPYRLASWSPDAFVFNVVREFTYPIGIGMFDIHAYPPKASITRVEHIGNRVFVSADVAVAVKQQRDRRIVRMPLKRDTLRETSPIRPVARYVVVGEDGKVAA